MNFIFLCLINGWFRWASVISLTPSFQHNYFRSGSTNCYKTPIFHSSTHFNCLGYLFLCDPLPFRNIFFTQLLMLLILCMSKGCTKNEYFTSTKLLVCFSQSEIYHLSNIICLSLGCCSCLFCFSLKYLFIARFLNPSAQVPN